MMTLEKAIWVCEWELVTKIVPCTNREGYFYYWLTQNNKMYFYNATKLIDLANRIVQNKAIMYPNIDIDELYQKHVELMALLESKKSNQPGSYYD
jgi:hypothetical protein